MKIIIRIKRIISAKYHEEQCFNYFYKDEKYESHVNRCKKVINGFENLNFILNYPLFLIKIQKPKFINIKMKSKAKNQTPSTSIFNDSFCQSSYASKDISFSDIKKEYINKYLPHNMTRKQKSRAINSLDELTKKFVRFVSSNIKNGTVNLNDARKKIKAKKRRIYDITNVLEGTYIYLLLI